MLFSRPHQAYLQSWVKANAQTSFLDFGETAFRRVLFSRFQQANMNKGYLISRFKCSQRRFNVCKVGSSLLTSTIQGHKKTTIEQDKFKIPLPAILLESATAIFIK